jgi:surfeit locus 1 family protein
MSGRQAGLFWPTVLSVVALAILIGLGTWQMQRLAWKNNLIAQIEARVAAAPVPFTEALERARRGEDLEYTRVAVTGQFIPGRERHLWVASAAGPGWHVYAPMVTRGGAGPVVIVNRGFVPDARRAAASRPEPGLADEVTLVGLLRKPEVKTAFTPDNDVARNIWHWRDLVGMAQSMVPETATPLAPFFLDAEKGARAGPLGPQGGVTRLEIANNHLQYAMTWYGLAATLVGVYVAFARARLQRVREDAPSAT